MNIIFVSTLDKLGYSFKINGGLLSFSLNDIHYGIISLINIFAYFLLKY